MFSWSRRKAFNPETGSFQPCGPYFGCYEHLPPGLLQRSPTASSSLKSVSFGGNVLEPRSDRVTLSLHPDSGPQHKLLRLFKVQKSRALSVLRPCLPNLA